MLKSLAQSLTKLQLSNSLSNNSNKLLFHTGARLNQQKQEKDDIDKNEFQRELSSGIKNLERLGVIKNHWSWPKYNRIIYPPQPDGEPMKNPFFHHQRLFIKYPAKKLWYPAFMIRGMSIDEAIKQLSFHKLKGAEIIKETLLEAKEMAVKEQNIEYKSNLWISYSTANNATRVKGVRKHKGSLMGIIEYKYSHYYVRLEEGRPPVNYHLESETYEARAKEYIEKLRKRSIFLSI